jgi:hypothetical protein
LSFWELNACHCLLLLRPSLALQSPLAYSVGSLLGAMGTDLINVGVLLFIGRSNASDQYSWWLGVRRDHSQWVLSSRLAVRIVLTHHGSECRDGTDSWGHWAVSCRDFGDIFRCLHHLLLVQVLVTVSTNCRIACLISFVSTDVWS